MKESANRYYIMMFLKTVKETFTSDQDFKKFLEDYSKKNKDTKSQFVRGNFKTKLSVDQSKVIEYTVYKKLTLPSSLEVIDRFVTENYEDEKSLRERYNQQVAGEKGKIYIGYMYNGQARTLPLFYKKDKKYTDYNSLTKLMVDNILDPDFLVNIWTNKKFNSSEYRKNIGYHLERIQVAYGKQIMKKIGDIKEIEDAVRDFMKAWCTTKGSINQRNVRDAGSIIKNVLDKIELRKKSKDQKQEEVEQEEVQRKKIEFEKAQREEVLKKMLGISEEESKEKAKTLKKIEDDIRLF